MEKIMIFTDGACKGNQGETNTGGWGAVLMFKDKKKEIFGGEANTTNNRMELTAIIEALKLLKRHDTPIEVYSDSAYIINCFHEKWYVKWLKNGWINSKKEPVENRDLWESLLAEVEKNSKISFFRAKGHLDMNKKAEYSKWKKKISEINGIDYTDMEFELITKMNHRADELANSGAAGQTTPTV